MARRAEAQPEGFVAALESLVVSAGMGSAADADALLACALWLLAQGDARVAELHAIAVRDERALVAAMLADAPPHRGLAAGGRLPPLDIPETARVARYVFMRLDIGPLLIDGLRYDPQPSGAPPPPRTYPPLATGADYEEYFASLALRIASELPEPCAWRPIHPLSVRRAVTRLGQHQSPVTIGRLLDDAVTRERDVIAIAARRPTTPAIVRHLTSRLRWMNLPNVRAALVANPCTPTRVALLLAVTCLPRLRGIAATGNVHPRVRELARLVEDARIRRM